jgi:hypothetical protein
MSQRHAFLGEALERYRAWAKQLGVPPHLISADAAVLRCQFYPKPQRATPLPGAILTKVEA